MASNENDLCADTIVALGLTAHPEAWQADTASVTTSDVSLSNAAVELLQGLVRQWLNEFQILAYVPLRTRVAYDDLADLTGVLPQQIRRIVRTTATAGILCEPHPESVAHTPLSTLLVKKPSFLDAVNFTAETVVPASLRMAEATRLQMRHHKKDASPYQIATNCSLSLAAACEKNAKLHRRAVAFQRLITSGGTSAVLHILSSIDLEGLGKAIVEVNAVSTAVAKALYSRSPSHWFVVQVREGIKQTESRLSSQRVNSLSWLKVQSRVPGTPQNETDAAVYLLHLPDPYFYGSSSEHAEICVAELRAHFDLLRINDKATLILIADVVPDTCGSSEAEARLQDLLLLQLGHDVVFDLKRLKGLMEFAREDVDRITVVKQLSSSRHSLVAFLLRSSKGSS
ncbi:O-methyltransferase [Colletotrichum abscissum]|uniref:O-methyltransferase n=1 Tax=Colletotrichum abscissum TaxID=1671311 RepID=A0A9Q0AY95_9PEZI|nr:O-methyltransferase [Colletotrichum abscissum]KAI3545129.1 O-methyltransferase [Colletotrichum abscissum]KAK1492894.1 O-methyltransferase [Colletotrichum abscissum]